MNKTLTIKQKLCTNELDGEVLYQEDVMKKEILLNHQEIAKYTKNLFKKDYDKYHKLVKEFFHFKADLCTCWWHTMAKGSDKEYMIRLIIKTSELYSDIMFLQLKSKAKFYVIYSGLDQALSYYITDDEDNVNDYANSLAFKDIEGLYYDELKHNMGYKRWTIKDIVQCRAGSLYDGCSSDDELHVLWGEIKGEYNRIS